MQGQWWRAVHARRAGATGAAASAPPPAQPDIDELLSDVRELRLTLTGDLAAAAGALDIGRDDVADEIVGADRVELADFLRRVRARAEAAEPVAAPAPSHRRRRALVLIPAVPLAGALAMSAAAAAGILPTHHSSPRVVTAIPAAPLTSTFHQFVSVVDSDPSASQVVAAAAALHQQLAALIATAPDNATGVTEVAQLLQMEQALLMRKQPPGSDIVLAASRRLAAQLLKAAPHSLPTSSAHPTSAAVPSPTATATNVQPTPTPTHTKHSWTTPAPAPTPTATSAATPTAAPTASSSSGHIISFGN